MATKKSSTKGSARATTKAAAPAQPTPFIQTTTKLIQDAVKRAQDTKQLPPKLRGPIFVGIWYNPISKKFEIVNQFE